MGYIEQSLGANEVVHYRAHLPFILWVFGWLILLLTLVGVGLLYLQGLPLIAAAAGAAGLVVFLGVMIPVWTTEIAVTNHRLIFKRGLFSRAAADLQLRAIEQVGLQQGVFPRLLNMGRVQVHGTGVDDVHLPAIADPVALQRSIQEAMGTLTPAGNPVPPATRV
jgi:membrane protein YdbS with pleckstrin-like domain